MNARYRRYAGYWIVVTIAFCGWPTAMTVDVATAASQLESQTDSLAINSTQTIEEICNNPSAQCSQLPAICLQCNMTSNCFYGEEMDVNCTSLLEVNCKGDNNFVRSMKCAYCYQFPSSNYTCSNNFTCRTVGNKSRSTYIATCSIHSSILCLGSRTFQKNVKCNWTSGYHWSTALILSVTLGGFGADRFYLGYWREALGKLFSLGGIGVWTLVDVVLIAIGYLKPEDGSLYL